MRRQDAFQLVSGGCTNKFSGFPGKQLVDRPRILALDRFTGEDHGAAVDIAAAQPGITVGMVDEMRELAGIDTAIRQEWRQHDGRAPYDLPVGHNEAAGQSLRQTPERDTCKQKMRGRTADVDADGLQLDGFLLPDGLGDSRAGRFSQQLMFMIQIDIVWHAEITSLLVDVMKSPPGHPPPLVQGRCLSLNGRTDRLRLAYHPGEGFWWQGEDRGFIEDLAHFWLRTGLAQRFQ